jgi:hypothetical protein
MATLADMKVAIDALPLEQKQELMLYLAAGLRAAGALPPSREFTGEQIEQWRLEDDEAMRKLRRDDRS